MLAACDSRRFTVPAHRLLPGATMNRHHITVPKSARYATLGEPHADIKQVWFVCHGYGQLGPRFIRHFACLNNGERLIVAPEGLSRYYVDHATGKIGASWMTREDRQSDIDDYVRYLDLLHDKVFEAVDRSAVGVFVLGFSQGAATVCRWVAYGNPVADHLILWGGMVPPDLDLTADADPLRHTNVSLVLGDHDEFANPSAVTREEARLKENNIHYEFVWFDGGHHLDDVVLLRLAAV